MPHARSWPARLLLLGAAALVAVCAHASHSKPQHNPKVHPRDQILALEQQWRQAQLTDDVSSMDKLLSDDFVGITLAGNVVTKAQQLDRMRTRKAQLSKLDLSDIKIKLVGQVAIVTSLAAIEGSADSKPLVGSFRYTHVYQHLPNASGWRITNLEATRVPKAGANPKSQE